MMRRIIVLSVLALVAAALLLAQPAGVYAQEQKPVPRVTLVKLWSVSYETYMAKFVGDKYVVVFSGHGDVSLDGKYISVAGSATAHVYEAATGRLLGTLSADGDGDTWRVNSWEPFSATKVWDRSGFFSGDSRYMVEDVAHYGTNSRVVDTTSWSAIPIDWWFTDTGCCDFYAAQLDYTGSRLVVGYIKNGTIMVFVRSGGKYVPSFQHRESGNYGRRIQMTLNGRFIVAGGIDYGYLDVWDGINRVVHYQLPDSGGLGALGISDPYNVGYIIGGTKNGWVVIAHFDPGTGEFKVLYQAKLAPDNSWFYNPFYDRWIPRNTSVFALSTHNAGVGVVYDVLTNKTVVINYGGGPDQWKASAVSPGGGYLFLGNTLYMVVRRDEQAGKPRVRFWGSMRFERGMQDLGSPIVFEPPGKNWHLYFFSGRVTVSKVYTESVPVTLVDDPDVLHARLGRMQARGLVRAEKLVENSGSVDALDLKPVDVPEAGFRSDHTVAMASLYNIKALYGWNGHGFGGATVSSVTVVDVPFDVPVDIYSEIKMQQSLAIVTVAPVFDWKKELLGVFGLEVLAGTSTATGMALASKAASIALDKAVLWGLARSGTTISSDLLRSAIGGAKAATKIGGKLLGIVGGALMLDAGIGVYSHYVTYSSVRSFVMVMPVVEAPNGDRYSAVALILPLEEIQAHANEYQEHVEALAQKYGIKDVGVQFIVWGKNWGEYRSLLEAGSLPLIDLKQMIETSVAAKHGLDANKLRIVGVKIVVENLVHGWTNLWDYVWGGLKVPVVTIIAGSSIQPKGVIAGGRTITDPSEIASLLGSVRVNGQEYELTPGSDGAYADFQFQMGVEKLNIQFGRRGFLGDVRIDTDVLVKKDMQPLGDYGYTTTLHYDWEDTMIRIERIEFAGMPQPMMKAERIYIYKYGNFTNDITGAFELSNKTEYSGSPSGYLYYYITRKNTKFIDPTNGGIMQYCKKYVFNYFYREPPDVGLELYLNGTQVTSTKARHATIVLNSTVEQSVGYTIVFSVKRLRGLGEETLLKEAKTGSLHVPENGKAYKTFLIDKYVDKAVEVMAREGTPAFVEITARITSAPYDSVKDNDEKTVVYYPPAELVRLYGKPAELDVHVYDALTNEPVSGATVRAVGNVTVEEQTGAGGLASLNVTTGLWRLEVSATGYQTYTTDLYVYSNMSFNVPLVPEGAEVPEGVAPPMNDTNPPVGINGTDYWFLSVQTMYGDGAPFPGALVSVYSAVNGSLLFQRETNGTGFVHFLLPNGSSVRVEVNATNPATNETYSESRELNVTHHSWLVFKLPWTSEYYQPEVMLTSVTVAIHRGQGYFFGNVSHLVLLGFWTNRPQTVTVNVTLVNADTNETIGSKLLTIDLPEGYYTNMTWFSVNASSGMHVRAYANITQWEADTDMGNNELWSSVVFLKPMVDIQVFALWRPVYQKQSWSILPEDVVEIDIGVRLPINTTSIPARLVWSVEKHDLRLGRLAAVRESSESLSVVKPGIVWRNITVTVPWTDKLVVLVNATHEWEDFGYNNVANVTIPVDPDVKLTVVEKPTFLLEGQVFRVVVNLTSNVPRGGGIGWVSVIDNTTDTLVKRVQVELEPQVTVTVEGKAPENPSVFAGVIRTPATVHSLTALYAGYDLYTGDNKEEFTATVTSYQWVTVIAAIAVIIAVIAAIRAVTHTIHEARARRRFVKRKTSMLKSTVEGEGEETRFVKKKEG